MRTAPDIFRYIALVCFSACLSNYVTHNSLDSIAGIVKGNILCIVKITLILFPEASELFAGTDLRDNIRVDFQHLAAAALVRCPFQSLQQRLCITPRAAQGVQNMYVVKISRTGLAMLRDNTVSIFSANTVSRL